MKHMFRGVIAVCSLVLCISNGIAAELEEQVIYRTSVDLAVSVDGKGSTGPTIKAGAKSRFKVLDNGLSDYYAVQFESIRSSEGGHDSSDMTSGSEDSTESSKPPSALELKEGITYFIPKKSDHKVAVEKVVSRSANGPVSGPLIVPYKWRLDDDSLSGEATIGYYAGWAHEFMNGGLTVTPFISAGLTQVSVATVGENGEISEDNKSGVTIAVGFLKSWDNLNVGFVAGQDRIGDKEWQYEGDTWISLSVGWDLTAP
ncbi:MAG: hypothetical protein AAF662_06800 [Pseudomonadota bacterium]